jgi:hypothetical protein
MENTGQLSEDFRRSLRHFVFYYTNGTLNWVIGEGDILKGIDYRNGLVTEASLVEQAFAIYANVIQMDTSGKVLNDSYAMRRAAQWIRRVCDSGYKVEPEFEDWEVELH